METMTGAKTGRTSESKAQSESHSKSGHAFRDTGTALGQSADDMVATLTSKADEAAAYAGRGIESVAEQIRSHTPDKGLMGSASNKVADSMEYGAKYLEDRGMTGMTDDVTKIIRAYPVTCLLAGVGAGYLLARAMTCRNT